ncbi:Stk1 family PASTA domain-containing Ser/Thr kinase [Brevibacillus laterosporus]|uniref:Serine/threonine-protein kinase PrkC n=1 Tax=Brevibacillus laterosporus TaxID=1465 RepID=A0AAP8QFP4_BRELA|nr:Stk1 family PASTA domain-containing Ser/Thr kinase [Brevibacillus laterosporus]MCR8979161.1 Stk1 family PASTA domain-containing Ser/Thr kinase [Brevibacillus laterosporus]MCZ0806317.1 Stk1 family PASTA domain-containing Ser/Thr kinase [Brevibacillus laterosporus]MCZ0824948.1 Stk1 family PASTA domain-containing Ser/Thr kinase [Brevibacillus laterosporus]MCZ0848853.1 Stk1 family PASTA domain-containing Ser/Thr kinase [Brevibacillus laterosporus]PPB08476.1 Stk1 family PASTA domain-containing S
MQGQRLGGRYQLEEVIGGGGMAIVYKARDLVLNRIVAVKLLRPQFGTDEDFVERFRREAQAVASLSHHNIVNVYDVGQDDDIHYMVMEYIEGSTLKEIITAQGGMMMSEAVRIAMQVCDALDHAHQNQIIHRDIKPHNIMIGTNGRVKVTDFGIARAVTSQTITQTGSVLGSVHYFSPEQARGGITAEKSDIYSLGIVLYEMVTGTLPFSGDSPITVALKHLQDPLPEPRKLNPAIPQSLENVIIRALAKDPFQRYKSAREMYEDLETCLSAERRHESKLTFASDIDDEETRVISAITPDMLVKNKQDSYQPRTYPTRTPQKVASTEERYRDEEEEEEENLANKKKGIWWKRSLLWSGIAVLFVVLAIFGFNLAMKLLTVPETDVPNVIGMTMEQAETTLKNAGLSAAFTEAFNAEEKGKVFEQDPAATRRVKENSTVNVMISKGKQQIPTPNYVGMSQREAEQKAHLDNFKEVKIVTEESSDVPAGQVINQDPVADLKIAPVDKILTLTVSVGKKRTKVPNFVGKSFELVKLTLDKSLKIGDIKDQGSYEVREMGVILSTDPPAGSVVEEGTQVNFVVSSGQWPSDAKIVSVPVHVEHDPVDVPSATIEIVVNDARKKEQKPIHQTISESTDFNVEVVLSPETNAKIEVKKNGETINTVDVDYQSYP